MEPDGDSHLVVSGLQVCNSARWMADRSSPRCVVSRPDHRGPLRIAVLASLGISLRPCELSKITFRMKEVMKGDRGTARGHATSLFTGRSRERPLPTGHAQALVNPLDVRGAEVHALPDASVDDVAGDRLPVGVGAGDADRVGAAQWYGSRRARAEKGVEDSLLRADLAAVAAGYSGCCGAAKTTSRLGPGGSCRW